MATLANNDRLAGPWTATAGQTDFPADFPALKVAGAYVGLFMERVRGGETVTLDLSDFSIVDVADGAFTARLTVGALAADVYHLYGQLPTGRAQAYAAAGAIRSDPLESDFTLHEAKLQEQRRDIGRSLVLPLGEASVSLPPASTRAGNLLGFDPFGAPIVVQPGDEDAYQLAQPSAPYVFPLATAARRKADRDRLIPSFDDWGGANDTYKIMDSAGNVMDAGGGALQAGLSKRTWSLTDTLTLNNPVTLKGRAHGINPNDYGVSRPLSPSRILWSGAPGGQMINLGRAGAGGSAMGVAIEDLCIDANGVAGSAVQWWDAYEARVSRCALLSGVAASVIFNNSSPQLTFKPILEDFLIWQAEAGAYGGHGIYSDGIDSGGNDTTGAHLARGLIQHVNGHGVNLKLGDGWTWNDIKLYRPDGYAGDNIYIDPHSPFAAVGNHVLTHVQLSHQMVINTLPSYPLQWVVHGLDGDGLIDLVTFPEGLGHFGISGWSTTGQLYGLERLKGGPNDAAVQDDMQFRAFSGNTLNTRQGSWYVSGTSGFNVANPQAPGGASRLVVSGGAGAKSYILSTSNFGNEGVPASQQPIVAATFSPVDTANRAILFGLFGGMGPTDDFIGFSMDTAAAAEVKCVCRSGGVATTISTTVIPSGDPGAVEYMIQVSSTRVAFWWRTSATGRAWNNPAYSIWQVAGVVTTHIPQGPLIEGFAISAADATAHSIDILDFKFAHRNNV